MQILLKLRLISAEQNIKFNENSRAYVNLNDPEPRNVFLRSAFEPDFFNVTKPFLPPKGVYFDLGANMGFCSFGLVPDYPDLSYHLFEANPNLISLLKKSIELYPHQNLILNHACVSDKVGTTRFQLELDQSGQSHVSTRQDSGIEVTNLALDEYCNEQALDCVDFAKIDLEGHELPALVGWRKYLSEHRVKAIYIEIMPENQARYNRATNAPLAFLESLGYELYLCKKEDFEFGVDASKVTKPYNKSLPLSHFMANDYPENFTTDALALAPN